MTLRGLNIVTWEKWSVWCGFILPTNRLRNSKIWISLAGRDILRHNPRTPKIKILRLEPGRNPVTAPVRASWF